MVLGTIGPSNRIRQRIHHLAIEPLNDSDQNQVAVWG